MSTIVDIPTLITINSTMNELQSVTLCILLYTIGDNWVVECGQEFWSRDDSVRFKHQLTNV